MNWPGCYIAHTDSKWIIGVSDIDVDDPMDLDIIIDPDEWILSAINPRIETCVYFISLLSHTVSSKDNVVLNPGVYRDEKGYIQDCITFVCVLPPSSIMDICYMDNMIDYSDVRVFSDVDIFEPHPEPNLFISSHVYSFPLPSGKWLCTQSHGGELTHFYASSHHAVDFQCPVGTRLLAIGDGVVSDLCDTNTNSGVFVMNLFKWNAISIRLDDGNYVDYVHIAPNSATVKVGVRVSKSDVIALSGDVGFSPEPHLHLEMHSSSEAGEPDINFAFDDGNGGHFFAIAGNFYSSSL